MNGLLRQVWIWIKWRLIALLLIAGSVAMVLVAIVAIVVWQWWVAPALEAWRSPWEASRVAAELYVAETRAAAERWIGKLTREDHPRDPSRAP